MQIVNVLDRGSKGFHFAESFLQILLWQVMSQLGIAFIDTLYPLPFPLIPFPDKGWPIGVFTPSVIWIRHWEWEGAGFTIIFHDQGVTGKWQQRQLFRVRGWHWGLRTQVESDHGVQIEGPGQRQVGRIREDRKFVWWIRVASIVRHFVFNLEFDFQLAEDNMSVKDRFSLLLYLKFPALLGILHLVQNIGSTAGAGQHIMGICKRLVIPNIIITLYQL